MKLILTGCAPQEQLHRDWLNQKHLHRFLLHQLWLKAQYSLLKLTIADNYEVIDQINASSKTKDRLKEMDNPKAQRMVSEVWILVKGSEAQASSFFASADVSYKSTSASGSFATKSGATFTFSKGSIMAYSLAKIDWDKKVQKKWGKVTGLKTDIYHH